MSKCVQWDLPYAKELVSGRGRGLTLTVGWLRLCNLACHKINNSDNALASLACFSLMSIVLSNELVDNIISNKNKELT